jgi:hypothetical protein
MTAFPQYRPLPPLRIKNGISAMVGWLQQGVMFDEIRVPRAAALCFLKLPSTSQPEMSTAVLLIAMAS